MDEKPFKRGLNVPFEIVRRGQEGQDIVEIDQEYKGEQDSRITLPSFFEKQDNTGKEEENPQTFPYRKARHLVPKSLKDQGAVFPPQESEHQIIVRRPS